MSKLYVFISIPLLIYTILTIVYLFVLSDIRKRLKAYFEDKAALSRQKKITVVFALIVCLSGIFLSFISVQSRQKNIRKDSAELIRAIGQGLESNFDNYDNAAKSLAGFSEIISVCRNTADSGRIDRLTAELEKCRKVYKASVIYILDRAGTVFLSTNRDEKDSFLGKNYSFRPYFQQAAAGTFSVYTALGKTSGRRGYYAAAPVKDGNGEMLAVLAVKKDIEDLEDLFSRYDHLFLSSDMGTVFFSSEKDNLYTTLPLSGKQDPDDLFEQYGIDYSPVFLYSISAETADLAVFSGKEHFITDYRMASRGWKLVHLTDLAPLFETAWFSILMSSLTVLAVFAVGMMIALVKTHISIHKAALSERGFRSMYEVAPEAILVSAKDTGHVMAANWEGQKLFGLSEDELKKYKISDLIQKDRPPFSKLFTKTGQVKTGRESKTDIIFQEKESSLHYIQDVTEEINRINELQNSEERYRLLAETLPETVFEINEKHCIEYMNTTGLNVFGGEDIGEAKKKLYGQTLQSLVIAEQRSQLGGYISGIQPNVRNAWQEYSFTAGSAEIFSGVLIIIPAPASEKQMKYRGLIIDVTERKQADYKLHRDEKLESMGLLAGGLAHDFNNLLTVIKAGLSLLEFDNANEDLVETLVQMNTAVNRGTAITKQLLTFSPGGKPVQRAVDSFQVIQEMLTVVFSGTAVKIKLSVSPDMPPLHGDPDQLCEVFQNLMLNARQAMQNRGVFTLTAKRLSLKKRNRYSVSGGEYLEFHFIDNGKGIPPERQARIFDPFFTTKTGGSGLGLSVTYSIISKHNGYISVHSVPDKKTDFTVILPVSGKAVEESSDTISEMKKGSGNILLMDDDNVIRMVGKKLLERLGYSVTLANNGEEAIELYKKALKGDKFGLVILDLTVPGGMGGRETIIRLKEIDPAVKAIVSSGYSVDPVLSAYVEYGFQGMVLKPYDLNELSMIVYNVINN